MIQYIIRRLLIASVFALAGSIIVFSLIHMIPGDPVQVILGARYSAPSEEAVAKLRHRLGLDKPLTQQYVDWLAGVVKFDFGESMHYRTPIRSLIFKRFPRTFEIIVLSVMLSIIIAIPLGLFAATHRGTILDTLCSGIAVLGLSTPVFVVGILLILVFSLGLKILPPSGFQNFFSNPLLHLQYIILPTLALSAATIGTTTRMTRAAVIEILNKDFVRTALAKGLSHRRVLYRHVLQNSLIPIVTMLGIRFGTLLGGTVIVESVFNYPGFSTLLITAVYQRDYPLIQCVLLLIMVFFICLNLLVDIINSFLDPRIRYS